MRFRIGYQGSGWSPARWLAAATIVVLVTAALWGGVTFSLWLQKGVERSEPAQPSRGVSLPSSAETAPFGRTVAGVVPPPRAGTVFWGAYRQGLPLSRGAVSDLSQTANSVPAVVMWYQEWDGQPLFDASAAEWLLSRGIVPMVTWEPWKPRHRGGSTTDQPDYRLDRIVDGAFDDFIERYALTIRAYGGPVFLRPFHEMDGTWYPWAGTVNGNSPEDLVAAWRHIHHVFDSAGATNVTWVWSVNHISAAGRDNELSRYWPGGRYVDWIGVSGFNWGRTRHDSTWDTFETVYRDRYEELLPYRKPIIISEIASVETGGNKAAWIQDAMSTLLESYPKIRGLVWYDRLLRPRDWRINSSIEALVSFRQAVARPEVLGAPHAATRTAPDDGRD
jgi:mannan endo-1,4-beta-mannosidase